MDHRFRNAKVAGGDALVEAPDTLGGVDSLHTLRHGHLAVGVEVQLKARLDEPDRIGEGGRYEAGTRCTHDVHQRRVGWNYANCVQGILGLRISTEVERTGWCDTDNVRTKTLEQGPGTFGLADVLQTLPDRDRLDRCREAALGDREDRWTPSTEKRTRTYSLSGMMVVRSVGIDAGTQLVVLIVLADQFPTVVGCGQSNTGRYTMNKRCGRTLQTRFDHFQRACYYSASSTCDTSSE